LSRSRISNIHADLNEVVTGPVDVFDAAAEPVLNAALEGKDAVVLGPGMGTGDGARKLLRAVLQHAAQTGMPLIIDADGLNILAAERSLLDLLPRNVILTPHPGEMARIAERGAKDVQGDRLGCATQWSKGLGCWLVLKGARTVVAGPDGEVWINPAVCEALATAGSGDVLAGLIGACLARKFSSADASCCAVYLHGVAGEYLTEQHGGPVGITAVKISEALPEAMNALIRDAEGGVGNAVPGRPVRALKAVPR